MQKKKGIVVIVAVILVVIVGWVWSSNRKVDVLKGYELELYVGNYSHGNSDMSYNTHDLINNISNRVADKLGISKDIKTELISDNNINRIKKGENALEYLKNHGNSLSDSQKKKLNKYHKEMNNLRIKLLVNGKIAEPKDNLINMDTRLSESSDNIKNGDKITVKIIPAKDSVMKAETVSAKLSGIKN